MTRLTSILLSIFLIIHSITAQCSVEKARPSFRRSLYEFSTEIVQRVARDSEYHFALSPLSLWTLISSIAEGAADTTLDEIRRVLYHHPNKCFNDKFYDIAKRVMEQNSDATLERSGALVLDNKLPVKENFRSKMNRIGVTQVLTPSFENFVEAASVINNFVNQSTHGAIDDVISPEDLENKYLIMIDTIYFKGKWLIPFSPAETEVSMFYSEEGQPLGDVNLMYMTEDFNVVTIDKIQAEVLELPYEGTKFSMLIFLPHSGVHLSEVLESIGDISLQSIFNLYNARHTSQVTVQMPRFKIESSLDNLVELLKDMGLIRMFETSATFPYLSDYSLYVSNLIQKANVEVTEEGTEASASSAVELQLRIMPEQFLVNKPFLFMIVDRISQVVLFTGTYSKPSIY